jgi:hypothetical protein
MYERLHVNNLLDYDRIDAVVALALRSGGSVYHGAAGKVGGAATNNAL